MPNQTNPKNPFDISPSGPFSEYLDPVNTPQPPQWSNGQQPSGWEKKAGSAAFLGSKLLEGITKGRVSAFARQAQQKTMAINEAAHLQAAVMNDPTISQADKATVGNDFQSLLAGTFAEDAKQSGALKDKSQRGHVARAISSVFDAMTGGKPPEGKVTNESILAFKAKAQGLLLASRQSGPGGSAEAESNKQQALWATGEQKARQIAQQNGRTVPAREDYDAVPEINQVRRWHQQYDPKQGQIFEQKYAAVPAAGSQQWALAEYTAKTIRQPPPSRQGQSTPENRAATGDYRQVSNPPEYVSGPPSAPPDARQPAAGSPARQGPPEVDPEDQEHQQMMEQLRQLAKVGPKEEAENIPIYDPKDGHLVGMGTKAQVESYYRSHTVGQKDTTIAATAAQRAEKNKQFWTKFKTDNGFTERRLTQGQQRIAQGDQALGIRGAEEFLREDEFNEKKAPQAAMSKLVRMAAEQGIPFKDFADHAGEVIDGIDDPDIKTHEAYILDQVSRIKQRQNGGDWQSLIATATGKKPESGNPAATPPPARSTKPSTPQKPDVKESASRIMKSIDPDLDDTPAAPPAARPATAPPPASPAASPNFNPY